MASLNAKLAFGCNPNSFSGKDLEMLNEDSNLEEDPVE
jgi:hypothetical protein